MKILLTGANGYIGRRLLPLLVLKGHQVVCLVRDKRRIELEESLASQITYFEADLLLPESLKHLPKDIDVAYYLIHSMGASSTKFAQMEQNAAHNFMQALKKTTTKQIVYLSGIVNDENLSKHLTSRLNVENILLSGEIPTTVLRAAIIIGSGGASFEIIRDLVEKLPVMVAPKWLNTKCQPIAIRNVMEYLEKVLLKEDTYNKIFDIGGPDILTYKEMLLEFARVRKLKRLIISLPVLSPKISSYWLYFVTSTSFNIAKSLVDSMKNEVVVKEGNINQLISINLIPYTKAIQLAFDRIAQNEVISSWKDAFASSKIDLKMLEYIKIPEYGCFIDKKIKPIDADEEQVLENIWSIGGERGWYASRILWEIRGVLDKFVGGVGLRRGRRSPNLLVPGDALDFWRVLMADKNQKRLLLFAEMKLPGEAWLEFKIDQHQLIQTATFRPHGTLGRLYWYSLLPFHSLIFDKMATNIIRYRN
ncbi:MAG: SDR family oxidoreductase [Candidatus Cyclobacteriaceae bacterium M3_2C_046]